MQTKKGEGKTPQSSGTFMIYEEVNWTEEQTRAHLRCISVGCPCSAFFNVSPGLHVVRCA